MDLLALEHEITFFPQGNIIVGEVPAVTNILGHESKPILKLKYNSKELQNEPAGIGMKDLSLFMKPALMDIRSGGNDGRGTESQFINFIDLNGSSCFSSVSQLHLTAVTMKEKFIGLIECSALDLLSIPHITCQNQIGEDLFEILINSEDPIQSKRGQKVIEIRAHDESIGSMMLDTKDKNNPYNFTVSFPRGLTIEGKCILLTASFLVYSHRFLPKFGHGVDGGSCCHIL